MNWPGGREKANLYCGWGRTPTIGSTNLVALWLHEGDAPRRATIVSNQGTPGAPQVVQNIALSDDGWFELVHSRLVPVWAMEWLM